MFTCSPQEKIIVEFIKMTPFKRLYIFLKFVINYNICYVFNIYEKLYIYLYNKLIQYVYYIYYILIFVLIKLMKYSFNKL